jgi:O-acetyl-ADP-ribose deacetylase (regulator of RNase III)
MIEAGTGNLLEADVDALVNTVNTEGVMGKGLALQFKRAFPDAAKAYEKACKAGEVEIGKMFTFDRGLLRPRWIINFPTKKHWRNPSKLSYVTDGLRALVEEIKRLKITSLAVPPLGCGNGGLEWRTVGPLIVDALGGLDIRVVLFGPGDAPLPQQMVNRTAEPSLTPGVAVFLSALRQYQATGWDYDLTLLEAQKLAYFVHLVGGLERLEFQPNRYGPYADDLRQVLARTEGHYTLGYGDANVTPATRIRLQEKGIEAADEVLRTQAETRERLDDVKRLIEGFETPFGMELLATVHWSATHLPNAPTLETVITAVHKWSSRKQKTMKPGHIAVAWERLSSLGWLERKARLAEKHAGPRAKSTVGGKRH